MGFAFVAPALAADPVVDRSGECTEAQAAALGALHLAAAGVSSPFVAVSRGGGIANGGGITARWYVSPRDPLGAVAAPSLSLDERCAVQLAREEGWEGRAWPVAAWSPNPAEALGPARAALAGRSWAWDRLEVEPMPLGSRVWLVRPNAVDELTVAVVTLDAANRVLAVEDRVEVWRPAREPRIARWLYE